MIVAKFIIRLYLIILAFIIFGLLAIPCLLSWNWEPYTWLMANYDEEVVDKLLK